MPTQDAVREQLEHRLADLTRRVVKIEGDLKQPHEPDWQERATQLENDEVLEELDQIRVALSRMESGSYGICSTCGRPIGAKRLAAVPSALTCVGCTG